MRSNPDRRCARRNQHDEFPCPICGNISFHAAVNAALNSIDEESETQQ